MTTSASTIFQLTTNQIINAAYRKLGVLSESTTANAAQLTTGTEALNAIVAEFQTLGMPLWARKELDITMVSGQKDYTIGVGKAISVPFPLHIYEATLSNPTTTSQIMVNRVAKEDFNNLPTGANSGVPVNYTYQQLINYGVFSVWPTPSATTPASTKITIVYQSPFEYFVASTDTAFFPQEWSNTLIYTLASALAPEQTLPLQDRQLLMKEAEMHLGLALSNGVEDGSFFFQVNR